MSVCRRGLFIFFLTPIFLHFPCCRMVTHLSIRLHSRDTHISSTCCYTMERHPTKSLLSVNTNHCWSMISMLVYKWSEKCIYLFTCLFVSEWKQRSLHCQKARLHLCGRHTQTGHRRNSDHTGMFASGNSFIMRFLDILNNHILYITTFHIWVTVPTC